MGVGFPACAGFCDRKDYSCGQLQCVCTVSTDMNMERQAHGGPSNSFTWILTRSWGRWRWEQGTEAAGSQVSARVQTGDEGGLGNSRNIQIGFTRYVNTMPLDMPINELLIKIKATGDWVLFLKQSLSQAGLKLTTQWLENDPPYLLDRLSLPPENWITATCL